MSCSLPQGIAGVFLEGCCPSGHHKCSLVWHCKLVLYTAVTEQSWWHPFCICLRGDIIIIFASSFCVLVLCSSSPNTPWHSRRPWVTSSLFPPSWLVLVRFITRCSALHPRVDQVALINSNGSLPYSLSETRLRSCILLREFLTGVSKAPLLNSIWYSPGRECGISQYRHWLVESTDFTMRGRAADFDASQRYCTKTRFSTNWWICHEQTETQYRETLMNGQHAKFTTLTY